VVAFDAGFDEIPPEAMPLSADPVSRIPKHTRSVRFEAYARAGLTRAARGEGRHRLARIDFDQCCAFATVGLSHCDPTRN
jgi:hypothetical protein